MMSSYKTACSVGAVALVLAGAVHADIDKNKFDQWSVTGGVITSPSLCTPASGLECGAAMTGDGFFSRLVKDSSSGHQYFQTIVTDPDANDNGDVASLGFSDENFVRFDNVKGILDKQRINQSETLTYAGSSDTHQVNFTNGSIIGTGWAQDFVELTQTIEDPLSGGGDGFQTDFLFRQLGYADGGTLKPYARGMKITNVVPIAIGSTTGDILDRQDFVLVEREGDFTAANGTVSLPPLPGGGVPPRGGTLTWTGDTIDGSGGKGDRIQAMWIGEDLGSTVGQQFGYGQYTNFDANGGTGKIISAFSLGETWGNPSTGEANLILNWSTSLWGDLKTEGTIAFPPGVELPSPVP